MRLTEEQVKAGILHPDKAVRNEAVRYFAYAFSRDPTIMPRVILAIEQIGWRDALDGYVFGEGLAQTEETMVWLLTELRRVGSPEDVAWSDYQAVLRRLVAAADPHLLRTFEAELSSIGRTDTDFRAAIHDRVRLLSVDAATCWRELELFCQRIEDKEYLSEVNLNPAYYLVEAIARDGGPYVDRLLELLHKQRAAIEHTTEAWTQPLLARLAGEMRLESAIGPLVGRLYEDDDWLNEECQRALIKIGTPDVVGAIAGEFSTAPWYFRLYATGVLEWIHSDFCVATCLALLGQERDEDLRIQLGRALLSHFAYDVVGPLRELIRAQRNNPEILSLQEELVTDCLLMGVEFPEMVAWKEETEDPAQWQRRVLAEQPDADETCPEDRQG